MPKALPPRLARIGENSFDLGQRVELSLELLCCCSFFIDSQLQQLIAHALKLFSVTPPPKVTSFSCKVGAPRSVRQI